MTDKAQAADLIRKIAAQKNLNQASLASLLGVDRVQVTRYLNGERTPSAIVCILLAALSENAEEREFWVIASGLQRKQLDLIAQALGSQSSSILSSDEYSLLAWWRAQGNQTEQHVRELVEKLLASRTK